MRWGWKLWAVGAFRPASRISASFSGSTGCGLNFRREYLAADSALKSMVISSFLH